MVPCSDVLPTIIFLPPAVRGAPPPPTSTCGTREHLAHREPAPCPPPGAHFTQCHRQSSFPCFRHPPPSTGGYTDGKPTADTTVLKDCAIYNVDTSLWRTAPSLPISIHHASTGTDSTTNKVYIFGGRDHYSTNGGLTNPGFRAVQVFDIATSVGGGSGMRERSSGYTHRGPWRGACALPGRCTPASLPASLPGWIGQLVSLV